LGPGVTSLNVSNLQIFGQYKQNNEVQFINRIPLYGYTSLPTLTPSNVGYTYVINIASVGIATGLPNPITGVTPSTILGTILDIPVGVWLFSGQVRTSSSVGSPYYTNLTLRRGTLTSSPIIVTNLSGNPISTLYQTYNILNYVEVITTSPLDYVLTMNYLVNGTAGGITSTASGSSTSFRITRIG